MQDHAIAFDRGVSDESIVIHDQRSPDCIGPCDENYSSNERNEQPIWRLPRISNADVNESRGNGHRRASVRTFERPRIDLHLYLAMMLSCLRMTSDSRPMYAFVEFDLAWSDQNLSWKRTYSIHIWKSPVRPKLSFPSSRAFEYQDIIDQTLGAHLTYYS
jgi:hypothetical protein